MMAAALAIATEGLTKTYRGFVAVNQINLEVHKGTITAFLGRNGAGKTTTLKMLLGITQPSSGSGTVLSHAIGDPTSGCEIRSHTAYVPEDKASYGYMTVEQLIRFTKSFYPDWECEREQRLMRQFDLLKGKRVKALSKGMRTKLALLLAFARRPQLLILDEPSEGLYPVSLEEVLKETIAAASDTTTIFFSSHQIHEVERIADRVCLIDAGKLIANFSLEQLRRDFRRITVAFAGEHEAARFNFPGVGKIRRDGRQLTFLANENSDCIVQLAREMNPITLEVAPISLREFFLDHVERE
jgi:ABC-2 type transport system ATP-binding protein